MPVPELSARLVLVTGGAGFIGSHLVDALLARGARVRVLDDLSTGSRDNLADAFAAAGGRLELVAGDVRELAACRRACEGAALVFHQAALGSVPRSLDEPAATVAINVQGTANVLEAARDAGVARVVYASSSAVYGDSQAVPSREGDEGAPLSPYALSKWMDEELAAGFGRCFGTSTVGLRYFNVYGARQDPAGPYAAVVPCLFRAMLRGEPPVVYGDGEQTRDFCYVGDVVTANLLAAGAPTAAEGVYNIAGGRQTSVNELVRAVAQALGIDAEPRHEPPRAGEVRHSFADGARAREALGFVPETPLEEGLARCRRFYRRLFAR
jgi:nucleoside-diphosphate-sugar epimerase